MQHYFNDIFMSNTQLEQNTEITPEVAPQSHCLNCGAELSGEFCHACGQQAGNHNPTIGEFVFEYLANAFMWDSRFLKTLWFLIRRPGYLTTEFLQGKVISYVHPLKLNMFMLFIFITLFLMFSNTAKLNNTVENFTNDEKVHPLIQMKMLVDNKDYAEKVLQSPRDTVKLMAPLALATEFPQFVTLIETIEDTHGESVDKWTAVIPHMLIDENIVIEDTTGFMTFNKNVNIPKELEIVDSVWRKLVNITTRFYPIIVLLTAPFLSMSLRLVQRKKKYPHINNFIFALHYTAFIELLTLAIYISYLIYAPSSTILQWVLIIGSIAYLTIAFRNAYNTGTWMNALFKALVTSIIYFTICLIVFCCIVIGACFIVAFEM